MILKITLIIVLGTLLPGIMPGDNTPHNNYISPTMDTTITPNYERQLLSEIIETGYTVSLYGVTDYQVDIKNGDPSLYNKTSFIRVTNTSDEPIILSHQSGSIVGWAFRATSIVDAADATNQAFIPSHPIDANAISSTSATIAPGAYFDIKGNPHHITYALNFIRHSPTPVKTVLITYQTVFSLEKSGEKINVTKTFTAPMSITLTNND
jgi:hypothetical protein